MKTSTHSTRMCTARSSSRLLGRGSASIHAGIHPPQVWACRPPSPLGSWHGYSPGVGLETPPSCGPGDTWNVGLETNPRPDPSTPLGCGPEDLQGMLGHH